MQNRPPTIGVAMISCMLALSFGCRQQGAVTIVLKNNHQEAITQAKVIFTGGEYEIRNLQPNQENSNLIRPTGESHLEFEIAIGTATYKKTADVYFEKQSTGSITVIVDGPDKIRWIDDTSLGK